MLRKSLTICAVCVFALATSVAQATPTCHSAVSGQNGSLAGYVPFGPSSPWNQDISTARVDPNSANIINYVGKTVPVHPDFGAGLYNGSTMGIPYVVVTSSTTPNATVH